MRILVTGCLGFIGSHFVKNTLKKYPNVFVVGFARNSDQWALSRLAEVNGNSRFQLVYGDFTEDISEVLEGVDIVFHFGAKSFVDHSVRNPESFIRNNIFGTFNLLEQVRKSKVKKYIQVSTDEVYGEATEIPFTPQSPLCPTNPYSASKASADLLVMSYGKTYGIDYLITRCENNYGSYQHPQKVLPVYIKCALEGIPLPVYSPGTQSRMWLNVEDHCDAIWLLVESKLGGVIHIGGCQEIQNLALARLVLKSLGKPNDLIEMIDTKTIRPYHDSRYEIDTSALKALGWTPKWKLIEGIEDTIRWFTANRWWLK